MLDRHDSGQAFQRVGTIQIRVFLFEDIILARVVVERAGDGAAETRLMGAAIRGMNRIGKIELAGSGGICILQGKFHPDAIDFFLGVDHLMHGVFIAIQIAHKRADAVLEVERHLVVVALILEGNRQATGDKGHLTEALQQCFPSEDIVLSKNSGVAQE